MLSRKVKWISTCHFTCSMSICSMLMKVLSRWMPETPTNEDASLIFSVAELVLSSHSGWRKSFAPVWFG